MVLKKLLVAFTTNRDIDGKDVRVHFEAGKVVELTNDELKLLDSLTKATGKLHYRSPINEGGSPVTASEPEIVEVPDFEGQDTPMAKKSVDQLKAYLNFHSVDFPAEGKKADLLALAQQHEAGESGDDGSSETDPDGGL